MPSVFRFDDTFFPNDAWSAGAVAELFDAVNDAAATNLPGGRVSGCFGPALAFFDTCSSTEPLGFDPTALACVSKVHSSLNVESGPKQSGFATKLMPPMSHDPEPIAMPAICKDHFSGSSMDFSSDTCLSSLMYTPGHGLLNFAP